MLHQMLQQLMDHLRRSAAQFLKMNCPRSATFTSSFAPSHLWAWDYRPEKYYRRSATLFFTPGLAIRSRAQRSQKEGAGLRLLLGAVALDLLSDNPKPAPDAAQRRFLTLFRHYDDGALILQGFSVFTRRTDSFL
jgi:hypothetical protein